MAVINAVPLEEALASRGKKQPSARTLRTQALEKDALAVIEAVEKQGAANIDFEDDETPDRYIGGLRAALTRFFRTDILIQKRRNANAAVAWKTRPEDEARVAKRKQTGARLGEFAKKRAGKRAAVKAT